MQELLDRYRKGVLSQLWKEVNEILYYKGKIYLLATSEFVHVILNEMHSATTKLFKVLNKF